MGPQEGEPMFFIWAKPNRVPWEIIFDFYRLLPEFQCPNSVVVNHLPLVCPLFFNRWWWTGSVGIQLHQGSLTPKGLISWTCAGHSKTKIMIENFLGFIEQDAAMLFMFLFPSLNGDILVSAGIPVAALNQKPNDIISLTGGTCLLDKVRKHIHLNSRL